MRLGFNSNLQVRDTLYRVQTEERGSVHPCIDTIVLSHGQVLHHRSTSSEDLLMSEAANEAMLRARVEQQHQDIIQALQTGTLPLGVQSQDSSGAIEVRLRNANPGFWAEMWHSRLRFVLAVAANPSLVRMSRWGSKV